MKKTTILIIAILLQFMLYVNAQVDLVNGIEWEYNMDSFVDGSGLSNKVKIQGDTIVDGKPCKILEREFRNCNFRPKRDFIYQEDNKVFYYHFQDSAFHILYDYNAEIGDTIKIRLWESYSDVHDFLYLKIDSISTVALGSENIKNFKAIYGAENEYGEVIFSDYYAEIMEGAGCLVNYFYVFDNGWCDGNHVNKLKCYYHPDLGNFGESEECSITNNVSQDIQGLNSIKVYPNPFSNSVHISFADLSSDYNLKLYDVNGNLVLTKRYQDSSTQIVRIDKLSALPQGLYYLVAEDMESRKAFSKRILKMSEL